MERTHKTIIICTRAGCGGTGKLRTMISVDESEDKMCLECEGSGRLIRTVTLEPYKEIKKD